MQLGGCDHFSRVFGFSSSSLQEREARRNKCTFYQDHQLAMINLSISSKGNLSIHNTNLCTDRPQQDIESRQYSTCALSQDSIQLIFVISLPLFHFYFGLQYSFSAFSIYLFFNGSINVSLSPSLNLEYWQICIHSPQSIHMQNPSQDSTHQTLPYFMQGSFFLFHKYFIYIMYKGIFNIFLFSYF